MTEIEHLLRDRLHELGDAFEPTTELPRRISGLIERSDALAGPPARSVRHTSRRRWATGFVMIGAVVAVVLVAVAYGPRSAPPGGPSSTFSGKQPDSQSTAQLRRALSAWSGFPVKASRRPLILLEGQVDAPSSGFPGDASKIAFGDGAINGPAQFPPGPRSADGFPLVTAKDAFGMFRSTAGQGPPATVDLNVTSVRLGTAVFETYRGYRPLPAWLFAFQGVQDPAAVLAVAPTAIFSVPRLSAYGSASLGVQLSSDGRTLTVTFGGAPSGTGPCTAAYSLSKAVSRTGVALILHEHAHDSGATCALPASVGHIVTVLSSPLGNRVVIDAPSGVAVPVVGPTTGGR
jgi:hypothetical protein